MERKNKASIFFIIGAIIFALSSTMLSFQLIIENYYTNLNIFTTIIISFICALWFYKR